MSRRSALPVSMIALVLATGCATSPTPAFYTLSAVQHIEQSPGASPIAIAIDLVTVPELVDRSQIVTKLDANRVRIDEFARWADPLKSQIPRVLAADLAEIIPGAIVSIFPQRANDNAYRVTVDVQNFDSSADGTVMLVVIWSVRPPNGGKQIAGRSVVHETAIGSGYDGLVKAHGRALLSVAKDIAAAMQSALRL
ncbi:PqiC family protein [Paraburkholderia madseniana]|uniref:PqiC family protein n=1 Tax=Paraburkholderia madseniana TaxID=2599607 RepID=UPI0038BD8094